MKLCRFGSLGQEAPGVVLEDGERLDVSAFGEDFDGRFLQHDGPERLRQWLLAHRHECRSVGSTERWGMPLVRPGKLVCVGLNYSDHARETGSRPPKEPILFFKATSALCGAYDDLHLPPGSRKTDWEVELAVVIGERAKHVAAGHGHRYVAGYALLNDYSEREYQLERGGQWVKGKSYDSFAPLGPFVATADEISNVQALSLWLDVNQERMQSGSTSNMIFSVTFLVEYISHFMTLEPGDVISTGTPAGVGMGRSPVRFLQPGDTVRLGATGLGQSQQYVRGGGEL